MRFDGTLKSWNDERGFGFIAADQGGDEIFVHITAISNRGVRPSVDQRLSFDIEIGPRGKKRAKNARPVVAAKPIRRPSAHAAQWRTGSTATLLVIFGFLVLLVAIAVLWNPSRFIALAYAVMSTLTFFVYLTDKSAASRGAWRTSEGTLHVLAIACGWPGALLAQQLLRHKSVKADFRAVFWTTVIVNVAALVTLCTPMGRRWLDQLGA